MKLLHLSASLSDEGDDGRVGGGVAGQLAHERRLSDAASREDPDALPTPEGQQPVNGGDARHHGRLDRHPKCQRRGLARQDVFGCNWTEARQPPRVEGIAKGVHDTSHDVLYGRNRDSVGSVTDRRTQGEPTNRAERSELQEARAQGDDLGEQVATGGADGTDRPDRSRQPTRVDQPAAHAANCA